MSEPVLAHLIAEHATKDGPLESLESVICGSSEDWGKARDLAWIYGIIVGWDDEDDEPGDGAMDELVQRFGWSAEQVARLRHLHDAFVRLAAAPLGHLVAAQRGGTVTAVGPVWSDRDKAVAHRDRIVRDCEEYPGMWRGAEFKLATVREES